MKKVIMLAAVVAALASCQSKANKAAEAQADSLALAMTPITEMKEFYAGNLHDEDCTGIEYVLKLNDETDCIDNTYTLDMTYLDAQGQGQNETFTSNGKQQTIHKVVNKKPVTAVKLTPKSGEAPCIS